MTDPHKKLLEAVAELDKVKRVKKAERSEPTIEVSEYHLVKSGISDNNVVRAEDLATSLGKKGHQHEITKKLRYVRQKSKVLPKPLEKPAAERIKRKIGFDNTKEDLEKWNAIVSRNRTAEHLSFPLNNSGKVKNSPTVEFLKRFRLKSDLLKKLEEVDPHYVQMPTAEEEKDDDCKSTMQEMILRRKQAAKFRALQSYKEAKARRYRKIKSKKFHRIEKKNKTKQQLMEFEKLRKENPQEALKKLEQLDKSRARERMSLRHKSTGQWAKNKQIRAKYDKDSRQELAKQLAISKELTDITKKILREQTSDSDEEDEQNQTLSVKENEENSNDKVNAKSEITEFIENYKKYCSKKNDEVKSEPKITEYVQDYQNWAQHENEAKITEISSKSNSVKKSTLSKNSNETSEEDNSTILKTEESEIKEKNKDFDSNKKSVKIKKNNTKENARCTIVSEEILLGTKVKLCKKISSNVSQANTKDANHENRNDACNSTSKEDVKESNTKTKNKQKETYDKQPECTKSKSNKQIKSQNIDDIFDIMEESIQRKIDEKLKAKNELEINSKEKQDKKKKKQKKEKNKDDNDIPDLEFKNFNSKPILDQSLYETTTTEYVQEENLTSLKTIANGTEPEPKQKAIDKSNNREVNLENDDCEPKYLKTELPDIEEEDELDNNEQKEEQYDNINNLLDAFGDENVVEEFRKEKEEEINNSQLKNVDLSMPGWGSWSGPNIKRNKRNRRKKQTVVFNAPKMAPRKDENKGKVIIFEDENKKLKQHLVSELPHPFTTVKDFEASLRAPVSRTFISENAHLRLIQPAVHTKIGQVIEPMDEDALVKKQPIVKKLQKRRIDAKGDNNKSIAKNNNKKRRK